MNTPQDNPELKGAVKLVKYLREMPAPILSIAIDALRGNITRNDIFRARTIENLSSCTFKQYPFLALLAGVAGTDPETLEIAAQLALEALILDATEVTL